MMELNCKVTMAWFVLPSTSLAVVLLVSTDFADECNSLSKWRQSFRASLGSKNLVLEFLLI